MTIFRRYRILRIVISNRKYSKKNYVQKHDNYKCIHQRQNGKTVAKKQLLDDVSAIIFACEPNYSEPPLFGGLHGIVLEPKVCLSRVDVRGGLMRLKWREGITRFSLNSGWKVYSGRGSLAGCVLGKELFLYLITL